MLFLRYTFIMVKVVKRMPNRLRKHRLLMGYRQKEVALLLGVENSNRISRWERGLAVPGMVNLLKLSIIYRTFPSELYFEVLLKLRREILQKEEQRLKRNKK